MHTRDLSTSSVVTIAIAASTVLVLAEPAAPQPPRYGENGRDLLVQTPGEVDANAAAGRALGSGDVNDDGFDDVAMGAPLWDSAEVTDIGNYYLFRGATKGLGQPAYYDRSPFSGGEVLGGDAVAAGDFDGDGRDEVAYGIPEGSNIAEEAGNLRICDFGSGFISCGYLDQDGYPAFESAEPFDHFGEVLAVGNFNGDEYDDLVVGVPGENLEGSTTYLDAGVVDVFYGGPDGIPSIFHQRFARGMGTLSAEESNESFGAAVAAGDFDDNGYDDLAIGAPNRDIFVASDTGEVVVLFGDSGGLSTSGHERFGTFEVIGTDAPDAHFGAALAAGDFNFSILCLSFACYDDLAVGAPDYTIPATGATSQGAIAVFGGSSGGLVGSGSADPTWYLQNDLDDGIAPDTDASQPEDGDRFGSVLHAAQIDSRLGTDLAVGVPDEEWGADNEQGLVHLIHGGASGLVDSHRGTFLVNENGPAGPGEPGDRYGASITSGQFDSGSTSDLAIGVPGLTVDGVTDAGGVDVLYNGCLFCDGFESGDTSAWSGGS